MPVGMLLPLLESTMKSRLFALLSALFLFHGSFVAQTEPRRTLLVCIDSVREADLAKSGVIAYDDYRPRGILSLVRDTAQVLVTHAEMALLRERGFHCTVLMEDTSELQLVRRAAYGPTMRLERPYHSYAALLHEVDSLRRAYPSLIRTVSIGRTVQGAAITAVKMAARMEEGDGRPSILIDGCHHSNELLGAEICVTLIHELAAKYGNDAEVTRWLERFQLVVVPVVNVDGHNVVTSGEDPRWRKNRHDTDGDGVVKYPEGVDLNRNYDFNWAHGGSGEAGSERYRGPFPFSEPETAALAALAREERFLCSITYHSQGEVIYYPWTWGGRKAPDDRLLTEMARAVAGSIKTMEGDTCYKAEYGAGLVGQSYTWLYGVLGTFDFVVETGKGASFVPPYEVDGVVRANLQGIYTLLRRAEGPGLSVHVRDAVTNAPLSAEVWFPAIETEDVQRRTSHPGSGILHRLLMPGTYDVIVSRPGYRPVVLSKVPVSESGWTVRDVALRTLPR
jgi:Zinc carboxypeptidase